MKKKMKPLFHLTIIGLILKMGWIHHQIQNIIRGHLVNTIIKMLIKRLDKRLLEQKMIKNILKVDLQLRLC